MAIEKTREKLKDFLREDAARLGFDVVRIAKAEADPLTGERLDAFLAASRHGEMGWMAETAERRRSPRSLWPKARSLVMLGMNYGPGEDPLALLARKDRAAVSVYARGRDYHDVVKGRLKELASRLLARAGSGEDVKVFVDTAPVMEKPLAAKAGLGWQGKHTNLVSREFGSWLFLGSIFTTIELEPDEAEKDRCGSCRACQDACPTNAFPAPYQLDARRCISYLTIELKGLVPHEFRQAMGNRVYGCDDCLSVCPWNKFARGAREMKLQAREELRAPRLADLLALDDAAFRAFFSGSPVKRIGRAKFVSNCLIAAGNSGDPALLAPVRERLGDESPLVRAAAVWALSRLAPGEALAARPKALAGETDETVRSEWNAVQC